MTNKLIRGNLNPLLLTFPGFPNKNHLAATAEQAIIDLFAEIDTEPLKKMCERAEEIEFPYLLNFVPDLEVISKRLLGPVRSAKVCYLLGHYTSSIAMSALACEMATIFHFEVAAEVFCLDSLNEPVRSFMKKAEFDKAKQQQRLELLSLLPFKSEVFIERAHLVKQRRNDYLHVLKLNEYRSKEDALDTFLNTIEALDSIVGLHPSNSKNGSMVLNPGPLSLYLEARGLIVQA